MHIIFPPNLLSFLSNSWRRLNITAHHLILARKKKKVPKNFANAEFFQKSFGKFLYDFVRQNSVGLFPFSHTLYATVYTEYTVGVKKTRIFEAQNFKRGKFSLEKLII